MIFDDDDDNIARQRERASAALICEYTRWSWWVNMCVWKCHCVDAYGFVWSWREFLLDVRVCVLNMHVIEIRNILSTCDQNKVSSTWALAAVFLMYCYHFIFDGRPIISHHNNNNNTYISKIYPITRSERYYQSYFRNVPVSSVFLPKQRMMAENGVTRRW